MKMKKCFFQFMFMLILLIFCNIFFIYSANATDYILYSGDSSNQTNAQDKTGAPIPLNPYDSFTIESGAGIDIPSSSSNHTAIQSSSNSKINNYGSITINTVGSTVYGIDATDSNFIYNYGTINITSPLMVAEFNICGINATDSNSIYNYGTIKITTSGNLSKGNIYGIYAVDNNFIYNYGSITCNIVNRRLENVYGIRVSSYNTIYNYGDVVIKVNNKDWGGVIYNFEIKYHNTIYNYGKILNTINGVGPNHGDFFVFCVAASNYNTIYNYGTISTTINKSHNADVYGLQFYDNNRIFNYGTISAAANESVEGRVYGVSLHDSNIFINGGSITARARENRDENKAYGIYVDGDDNTITNSGSIKAYGKTSYAIYIRRNNNVLNLEKGCSLHGDTADLGLEGTATTINLSGQRYYITYDGIDPTVKAPGLLVVQERDGNLDGQANGLIASVDPKNLPFSSSEAQTVGTGQALHSVLFGRMKAGGNSWWTTGYGNVIYRKDNDSDAQGIVAGIDKKVGFLKRLGFFVGLNWANSQEEDSLWEVKSRGYTLGTYAEAKFNKLSSGFVLSYGKEHLTYTQDVVGRGEVESESDCWYLYPEVSVGYLTGNLGIFKLQPSVRIGYLYLKMDEYKDDAGLKVDKRTSGFLTSRGELNFITKTQKSTLIPRIGIANHKRITGDNKVDMWVAGKKFSEVSLKEEADETYGFIGMNANYFLRSNIKLYTDSEFSFGSHQRRGFHLSLGVIISL